jgi:hypothetical protein
MVASYTQGAPSCSSAEKKAKEVKRALTAVKVVLGLVMLQMLLQSISLVLGLAGFRP